MSNTVPASLAFRKPRGLSMPEARYVLRALLGDEAAAIEITDDEIPRQSLIIEADPLTTADSTVALKTARWDAVFPCLAGRLDLADVLPVSWLERLDDDGRREPLIAFRNDGGVHCARVGLPLLDVAFRYLTGGYEDRKTSRKNFPTALAPSESPGRTFDLPVVDLIRLVLKRIILNLKDPDHAEFGPLSTSTKEDFVIHLTHDLDVVRKDLAVRIKKGGLAFRLAIDAFLAGRGRDGFGKCGEAFARAMKPADYLGAVHRLIELEQRRGMMSTWFISGNAVPGPFYSAARLRDPVYSPFDPEIAEIIEAVRQAEGTIGLHGSTVAATTPERIVTEKEALEEVVGLPIRAQRFHWLAFHPDLGLPVLQAGRFATDASLAFANRNGFRRGTASPFAIFDPTRGESAEIIEIPIVFMDMTMLFSPSPASPDHIVREALGTLEWVRRVGGSAAINWHPESLAADYCWGEAYEAILDWITKAGGAVKPWPSPVGSH